MLIDLSRLEPAGGCRGPPLDHRFHGPRRPRPHRTGEPQPCGLRALKALAAIGHTPDDLRPTLRAFSFSPLRKLTEQLGRRDGHPDYELRALARELLAAG
ncbi:hypothetical protein [Streptomyces sp. YIM S03343]